MPPGDGNGQGQGFGMHPGGGDVEGQGQGYHIVGEHENDEDDNAEPDHEQELDFFPHPPNPTSTPGELCACRDEFLSQECRRRPNLAAEYGEENLRFPLDFFQPNLQHLPYNGCENGCRCVQCGHGIMLGDHGTCDRCQRHMCMISRDWGDGTVTYCGDTVTGNIEHPWFAEPVHFVRLCDECMDMDATTR